MRAQPRIIPDLYQPDQVVKKTDPNEPATEEDDGRETMFETIHRFTEGRRAYKKKIISEVMAAAFPNLEDYNVDEFVEGRKILPKANKCVRCLQFFNCWVVPPHDAVKNNSQDQLMRSLEFMATKARKGELAPDWVNDLDEDGHTILMSAVHLRRSEMVEGILSYDADPNIVDEVTGMSPLMYGVASGCVPVSIALLRKGAFVNMTDFKAVSALMIAASLGDIEHCEVLMRAGTEIDLRDKNGWTALHYAAFGGSTEVCYFLLNEGADRDMRDHNKRKPMHIAEHLNHGEVVSLLEKHKRILL
eukprot:CAMPEP_0114431120 /NCGR_PEP_ID=MMETSP0103-20121206/10424_1 /TAXON_ID=37642 ORGANISM="Paraphysomonas imperforata, Strain PA2" /NCGR_SAMPLE_ID=MMETSP0103 /ASSEMBLY_ACC=CAM_ASM_000201 /LENGTH=302 /DNA_ID=CAMNT_0001600651 /DNA_START=44 /DNA_END=952 /DNA_ORIENTATION=-